MTLSVLANLPTLRLVISDDFQINDPDKLELLPQRHIVRAVPADAAAGKLHSKVFLIHRADGTRWAMVGSANLTWQGLFSNQEASIILDSTHATDDSHLSDIEAWFEAVLREARQIDFQAAKRIFQTRARYRLQRPDSAPEPREEVGDSRRYWALKTTAGAYGDQHWPNFLAEDVIAIGWHDLDVDPSIVNDSEIEEALRRAYREEDVSRAARKIRKFVDMSVGDLVLVCRGYPANSTADVHT